MFEFIMNVILSLRNNFFLQTWSLYGQLQIIVSATNTTIQLSKIYFYLLIVFFLIIKFKILTTLMEF